MDAAGAMAVWVELVLLRVGSAIASCCGDKGEESSREVLVLVDMDRAGQEWDGAAAAAAVVDSVIVMVGLARSGSNYSLLFYSRCITPAKEYEVR